MNIIIALKLNKVGTQQRVPTLFILFLNHSAHEPQENHALPAVLTKSRRGELQAHP